MEIYSYHMYFGRNIKGTDEVSRLEFDLFIQDEIVKRFQGFTVTSGMGYWEGKPERVFIVEVFGNDWDEETCKKICRAYCVWAKQDCVALKSTPIDPVEFVSATKK